MIGSLLSPLGEHRKTHIQPSKGKKRKRKSKDDQDDSTMKDDPPPPPEIGKHILIGINSVTRHLEMLAARNAASTTPIAGLRAKEPGVTANEDNERVRPLGMVILTHPKPFLSPAHAHLPTLIHLCTLRPPTSESTSSFKATRLIPLATSTDARIASNLHIPRVGALAIFADAPGAKALEDFVREKIDTTSCLWIDEAMDAKWRGINVKNENAAGKEKGNAQADKKPKKP
jgi:ribonuclease P/MRP protein subunit POP3